jgi:5-(carboxyamino)imidazole ribonucleotide synthase
VGAREVTGSYDDLDAVAAFAKSVDVVTFEFENVSAAAAEIAAKYAPVRPGGDVLHITQNRLREKSFLQKIGVPTTTFKAVECATDCEGFIYPAILKTAGFGYDGKGQRKVASVVDAQAAFRELGEQHCWGARRGRALRGLSLGAQRPRKPYFRPHDGSAER